MEASLEVALGRRVDEIATLGEYGLAYVSGSDVMVQALDSPGMPLRMNRKVTALKADEHRLVIAFETALLVYDVSKKTDIFYKELPDGATSLAIGKFIAVGGNCVVSGFSRTGFEVFWTVAGDTVRALDLSEELLIGTDDYDIKIFRDELVWEITETAPILALKSLGPLKFAYGTQGSLGVYDKKRVWRVKQAWTALEVHGEYLLIGGSSFVVRRLDSGTTVYKNDLKPCVILGLLLVAPCGQVTRYDRIVENECKELTTDKSVPSDEVAMDLNVDDFELVFTSQQPILAVSIISETCETGAWPSKPSTQLKIKLPPATLLKIQVVLTSKVVELEHRLPKFSCFKRVNPQTRPQHWVQFSVKNFKKWVSQAFMNLTEVSSQMYYKADCELWLEESNGLVKISCDSLKTTAEVVQDMARFLKVDNLESIADYPIVDIPVEDKSLTATMADQSASIKALIVQIEDARLLGDMRLVRQHLVALRALNSDLVADYNKRELNHQHFIKQLKELNLLIQRAANLRVGKPKQAVINNARAAVAARNSMALQAAVNGPQ